MIKPTIAKGYSGLVATYGDPIPFVSDKAAWEARTLVYRDLPTPLVYAYGEKGTMIRRVRAHRLVADALVEALMACLAAGVKPSRLKYGGCYIWRPIRGSRKLSTHSWGVAVDIEPTENQLGTAWVDNGRMLDPRIVKVFKDRGWFWGNDFRSRKDPQHFQCVTGY